MAGRVKENAWVLLLPIAHTQTNGGVVHVELDASDLALDVLFSSPQAHASRITAEALCIPMCLAHHPCALPCHDDELQA